LIFASPAADHVNMGRFVVIEIDDDPKAALA
jgi:hypothetical protein